MELTPEELKTIYPSMAKEEAKPTEEKLEQEMTYFEKALLNIQKSADAWEAKHKEEIRLKYGIGADTNDKLGTALSDIMANRSNNNSLGQAFTEVIKDSIKTAIDEREAELEHENSYEVKEAKLHRKMYPSMEQPVDDPDFAMYQENAIIENMLPNTSNLLKK